MNETLVTMSDEYFTKACKKLVYNYTNDHFKCARLTPDDVFVVWFCRTSQNKKALLSTNSHDGMYYEIAFTGDKDEIYLDDHKKVENKSFTLVEKEGQ